MWYNSSRKVVMNLDIYRKMYLHMFNAVTDVLNVLETDSEVAEYLCKTQQECEEMFMNCDEDATHTKTP